MALQCAVNQHEPKIPMNSFPVENILVDEAHQRTYVVMAHRTLTDGELYSAIRVELLKRGRPVLDGERLVIMASENPTAPQKGKGRSTRMP